MTADEVDAWLSVLMTVDCVGCSRMIDPSDRPSASAGCVDVGTGAGSSTSAAGPPDFLRFFPRLLGVVAVSLDERRSTHVAHSTRPPSAAPISVAHRPTHRPETVSYTRTVSASVAREI